MKEYDIEYYVKTESGKWIEMKKVGIDITITDNEFSFFETTTGTFLKYYLKNIPETQGAKEIKCISIDEILK